MCGIAGKIYLNENKKIEKKEISKMVEKIKHRGPDDDGVWIKDNIGMGHSRLSIFDTTNAGHQPMRYNSLAITFNGEIYNFQLLKKDLIQKGYKFYSQTDTEVLLALYQDMGKNCLKLLRGMFAFAIWDDKNKTLFCARDRLGKKPFKYYFDQKTFIFSSELKAILTQQEIKKEVDWSAIDDYLVLQYVPAPKTGFKNIFKLPQAHFLEIKNGKLKIEKYWDLNYNQKLNLKEAEWEKLLENKLMESVKIRLASDVPVGAFLSGGIDSGAVVALMSQTGSEVKTFSIGFSEKKYDETSYAKIIAQKYTTKHHEIIVKPKDINLIEKLTYHLEEPYGDSSVLPSFILSKFSKKYVSVALTGDGGDENFGGYDRYLVYKLGNFLKNIPYLNKGSLFFKFLHQNIHNNLLAYRGYRFLKTLPLSSEKRYLEYICYFNPELKNQFYKEDFHKFISINECTFFENLVKNKNFCNNIDKIFYLDFFSYLPDDLMVKIDISAMANGLEARSPFLDHELIELTAKMPAELKLKFFQRKYILKKILKKYLPNSIITRRKKGFSVPLEYWLKNNLNDYIYENITGKNSLTKEIMKEEMLKQLLTEHFSGRKNNGKKIWALIMLNSWHQQFFKT